MSYSVYVLLFILLCKTCRLIFPLKIQKKLDPNIHHTVNTILRPKSISTTYDKYKYIKKMKIKLLKTF